MMSIDKFYRIAVYESIIILVEVDKLMFIFIIFFVAKWCKSTNKLTILSFDFFR